MEYIGFYVLIQGVLNILGLHVLLGRERNDTITGWAGPNGERSDCNA